MFFQPFLNSVQLGRKRDGSSSSSSSEQIGRVSAHDLLATKISLGLVGSKSFVSF